MHCCSDSGLRSADSVKVRDCFPGAAETLAAEAAADALGMNWRMIEELL